MYEIIDAQAVLNRDEGMPLIDVRPAFMYEESRIPGAVSVPYMVLRDEGGNVSARVAEHFKAAGVDEDTAAMVYCYDGGLAREVCDHLDNEGFRGIMCYEGSWVDWISDPSRPVEK